jgi:hypothetical protein
MEIGEVIAKLGIKNQSFKTALDQLLNLKKIVTQNENMSEVLELGNMLDDLIHVFSKCAKNVTS